MINVRELAKSFPAGRSVVHAVRGVTFNVSEGEVYGLLGPNGAGKTTTLRMIMGLLPPTSGDILVDGRCVSREPDEIKRRIGLVSANTGLYQWLTPRELLSFFADVYDVAQPIAAERISKLTRLLDLKGFLETRCAFLSTGQRQRVNLARALVHNPPIMLLDEPTRGLDVIGTQVIFEYLAHLRNEGKAVIISTHQLEEAERFADRFGLLNRGALQHQGTLAELQASTGCRTLVEMFLRLLGNDVEHLQN